MGGVIVDDVGAVRWIRFNRPEHLNTYKYEDVTAVHDAVVATPEGCRVIALTGAGERAFSAGMHLDLFRALVREPEQARPHLDAVRDMIGAVRRSPVVTVAAINGHCLGAAFELILACDFRIASGTGLFGLPEIRLGLPCILESALLSQYVGLDLSRRMMLTGELFSAAEMADRQLLRLVGDGRSLVEAVDDIVAAVVDLSPAGVASQKRIFDAWQNRTLDDAIELSLDEIAGVFAQDSTRRALERYLEGLR